MPAVWSFPTRTLFGEGMVAEAGPEARRLGGRRALIVTDPGVREAGLADEVSRALEKAGVLTEIFDEVGTNPNDLQAHAAAKAYTEAQADIVVGVGGGAPIDVAKLVRLTTTHSLPLAEYDEALGGEEKITQAMPPMIAIPTTAGTGSEVAESAIVTLTETGKPAVIASPQLMPNLAILDPELTVSLPPELTAATGLDALAHNIEAYCAKGDHPMADAIALEGIELIANNLVAAYENGHKLDARGAMLKASMMGGVALQKGLGACHALAHALGAKLGIHHGLANALCLPAVLDFNRAVVSVRIARIARILGVKAKDVDTLAFECSGRVRALRKELGLPSGLAEVGVTEDHIPELATLALADPCHQWNPRPCTREDMLALYRASM